VSSAASARPNATGGAVRAPLALVIDDLTGPVGSPMVRNVSLALPRGETHVVLGPMHSGKSLLLRLVLGLQRSEHGLITIDGTSFDAASPDEEQLRRVRRGVGVLFESSALVSRLTMLENVELPLVEHTAMDAAAARDKAVELLREVGVESSIERTPELVSRLDRRRAALARAFALDPHLLLVDEPGHSLDADAATEFDDRLRALLQRHGCAALICSQEVRYAFQSPGAVSVLANGRVVERGDLDELRRSRHEAVRRFIDRRGAA
jgi:ABC-type transporter Mla maintaining outer membrane lipid asymmetry ATPase subunit MlaF